jgi:gliding motility-associated-like protein
MKLNYLVIIFLMVFNLGYSSPIHPNFIPFATITGGAAVCQNGSGPIVTFTGSGGTAPYTFTYKINGGVDLTISSPGASTIATLQAPTAIVGNFNYALVSVTDASNTIQAVAGSVDILVSSYPVVEFLFNDDQCSGSVNQFTSIVTGGSAANVYSWNFGDGSPLSNAQNPSHIFTSLGCGTQTFNAVLTVTNNGCSSTRSHMITVKQEADIAFFDVNFPLNPFDNCSNASTNPSFSITVGNSSVSTCVLSYSISWGDGATENNVTFPKSHTYTGVGAYSMVITAVVPNACNTTKTYIVRNVSNPLGGINSPGSTQNLCAPTAEIQFSLSNWGTNSPDTTYTVDYGDGTIVVYTQAQLVSSIYYNAASPANSTNYPVPYSYTSSHCPAPSFEVNLTITNACGTTPITLGNVTILKKPDASFAAPIIACVGTNVLLTNTTSAGYGQNCNPNVVYKWNFGDGSPIITTTPGPAQNISHTYYIPGTYSIILTAQGFCGSTTFTRIICIEPPVTSSFTLNTNAGCAPLAINTNNTTNLANQCSVPVYSWEVSYAAGNCGTSITPLPFQTTQNATYNFTEAGTYTILLKTTNSCGTTTSSQTVVVKKLPTVALNAIANFCGTASISPLANVPTCVTASGSVSYAWSFPGGNPSTSTLANPQNINYATPGNYSVSLVIANECGNSNTATQTFAVNPVPTITNTTLSQTICSGTATSAINLTATPSGATFSWTAVATAGISGFTPSGTTATIPSQTITTVNANAGTVSYTVKPKIGNCVGALVTYIININPAPVITTQPSSSTICVNGVTTPLAVAISSSTATPTFQWYSNTTNATTGGTLITGETASTYIPPTNSVGELYYYCIISLSSGGCSSLTSNSALVKIVTVPFVSTQPLASQVICVGTAIQNPLTVNYTNGAGTASYQWFLNTSNTSTGGTSIAGATAASYTPPTFTTPGIYYFYVTVTLSGSNCGNVTSQVANVTVFADPTMTSQPVVSQILCQGATPTTLEAAAAGGNGTFSYQWYRNTTNTTTGGTLIVGASNATFIPPTASVGTVYYYCIISQSTLGCAVTSATGAIIVNQAPTATVTPAISAFCLGGSPTPLSLTITNGAGTPAYQWYSNTANDTTTGTLLTGETNATLLPQAATVGTTYYYCSIFFAAITGSCSAVVTNAAEVTIIASATLTQSPIVTQNLCVGATIATPLTVSFINGTGTATYQWFSNTMNSNTGGTVLAGTNAATFTPAVFTTAGTYYFYVEISFSGSGCGPVISNAAEVIVFDNPVITTQPLASQILCQNAIPTNLVVAVSGGIGNSYTYQWYSSATNSNTGGTLIPGETNATFVPLTNNFETIYYYCTISQDVTLGCFVTSATAQVSINQSPAINVQPQDGSWCVNALPSPLSIGYINGAGIPNYQWYSNTMNSSLGGTLITGETNSTFLPSTSTAGSFYYYCIISFPSLSGGCEVITSSAVAVIVNPFPIIGSENVTICSTNLFQISPSDGGANLVPFGTTYTWSLPVVSPAGALMGFSAQAVPQSQISQTLVNTTASAATITYTVTPISGSCLGSNFTVTVTVNPGIDPNINLNNNDCFGVDNASIATNITGGIPPYTISWVGPNGFTSSATSISNIEPGSYTITIEDLGNCPFTNSYTITEPNDLLITTNSENNSSCFESNNGNIDITVSGGTGAYFYSWTKDTLPFATTQDLTNLSPGMYQVTVSDENNCGPKTAAFTITEPPLLVISLVNKTNVNCFGAATGAINVGVVGGTIATNYNFAWTGPNGFLSANQNLTALTFGTYNLTVTDDNGCQKTLQVQLTQSTEIIISYTTTVTSCFAGNDASLTASIAGGNAPYTFVWDNLATSLTQNNLSAGNYTITVTDNLGCVKSQPINIPDAPIFTVNPVVNNISCFGANNGSINLNIVGGTAPFTLTWSDGSTAGSTRNNLVAGTYTATISDGTPCFIVRPFTIIEPQPITLTSNVINPTDCAIANGGAIDLIVSGGTPPFIYTWSNGATTEDLANVGAGNYSVTVVDARGCTNARQFTLLRPSPLTIAVATQTDVDCINHEVLQSFVAQASGGIPPYQYQWSSGTVSGANNQIMNTDINGIVILTVTDAAGCIQNYSVAVDNLEIGYASFDVASFGFTTFGSYSILDPIQFTSTITGDYTSVSWNFGDGTFSTEVDPLHTYLIPKEYVVTQTVTYPFGCVYTFTMNLNVDQGYVLVLPTGFTPNKDGLNENYRPVARGLTNMTIDIYDSWGSIIYAEKGDVIKGWNGTIKGYTAENGNYYSKVSAKTFYGTIVYENQTIVLIK